MDAIRVVDVWQVVLQEPRVAAKEATLLLQAELEQHMVRGQLEQQNRLVQRSVERLYNTERQRKVTAKKEGRASTKAMRSLPKKKKKKEVAQTTHDENIIRNNHIDVRI